jgi:NAD+ diphosphatase
MKRNENIVFFQGNDVIVPEKMPDEDLFNILSEDRLNNHIEWKNELKNYISHTVDSITFESIPLLQGTESASAALLEDSLVLPNEWKRVPIRSAFRFLERTHSGFPAEAQDLFRAFHILQWKKNTVFCGRCGGKCKDSEKDISRICTSCGNIMFPRISPAIIVLITDDEDRILLANNRNFKNSLYSLLAGFVEAGETLEETVVREVKEEVNIDVHSIQYVLSQPWPFPDSIMLGFRAKYAGGTLKPDGNEITDAQWYSRNSLPDIPGPGAIARYIIDQWQNEKSV